MTGRGGSIGGRLPWARLAAEFLAIVLGVLLALAVSQWWEGREDEAAVDATLAAFRAELLRNRDILQRRLSYHESLLPRLDSLTARAREGDFDVLSAAPFPGGTYFLTLPQVSWTTAVATEAVGLIDGETLRPIAAAYAGQDALHELEQVGTMALFVPSSFDRRNAPTTMIYARALFGDVVSNELHVLMLIDSALVVLDDGRADQ